MTAPAHEIQKSMGTLMRELTPKQLRSSVRKAYRRVGSVARRIVIRHLHASGIDVQGDVIQKLHI